MTKDDYDKLSDRDKIFANLLLDIAHSLRQLHADIRRDLEEAVG